ALRPGATALVCGGERLSYGELNRRANRLAHQLRGLGVGREVLVGVCLERSLEMAVGLLGVLKAGGAYLPLDPEQPEARLAFMVEEAEARVLLTRAGLRGRLPEQARVLEAESWGEGCSEEDPEAEAAAGDLAYVIYTSGS